MNSSAVSACAEGGTTAPGRGAGDAPAVRLIAIVLPYAVTIRDFVHSGTLRELLGIPDVGIDIYTQNPQLPEFDDVRSERVSIRETAEVTQGWVASLLRRYYPIIFADEFVFVQQNVEHSRMRSFIASAVVAGRKIFGTARTLRLYGWLLNMFSARPRAPLLTGKPDLVIGTRSLVNSLDYPYMVEAARRRLPLMTVASSWDNFTTKGFFPFPVERTVVWNRKMAEELVEIFGVPNDHITIAGYPRLNLIRDTGDFVGPEDYLTALGLGQYRRFVLQTVSYAELTRSEPDGPPLEYLLAREMADALLPVLPADTCLLVRLHPYSDTREEALLHGVERLRVFVPGRQDRYVERVMSVADEIHLACQLNFSSCIISMASTITIDALALRRPIINLAYDPAVHGQRKPVISRFYRYNHFRDLLRRVRPPLAKSPADVVRFVERNLASENGKPPGADLGAFENDYVPSTSTDYPTVVRQTVVELLTSDRPALKGGRP